MNWNRMVELFEDWVKELIEELESRIGEEEDEEDGLLYGRNCEEKGREERKEYITAV